MEGYEVVFPKPGKADIKTFHVKEPQDNECQVKVLYNLISSGTEKAYLSGNVNTANKFPAYRDIHQWDMLQRWGKM